MLRRFDATVAHHLLDVGFITRGKLVKTCQHCWHLGGLEVQRVGRSECAYKLSDPGPTRQLVGANRNLIWIDGDAERPAGNLGFCWLTPKKSNTGEEYLTVTIRLQCWAILQTVAAMPPRQQRWARRREPWSSVIPIRPHSG